MISDFDEYVGWVFVKFEEFGFEDDMFVVFMSDNGMMYGSDCDLVFGIGGVDLMFFESIGGLCGFKGSVYEGGLRVLLFVCWLGCIEVEVMSDYVIYFVDWFLIFQVFFGEFVEFVDGVDFGFVLLGDGVLLERMLFVWVFVGYGGQFVVCWGDDKLVCC